jgi:hypothetical protein
VTLDAGASLDEQVPKSHRKRAKTDRIERYAD